MLEIRELTIRYLPWGQSPVHAVKTVTLSVDAGEILGIMGESGSGKSTLATTILNLLPAHAHSSGAVLFEGRDVLAMRESELRAIRGAQIAMIPQDPATSLNPVLKIGAQISEVLRAHLQLTKLQRRTQVLDLLREVGFDEPERIASAYPHELSGGQRQRVVIAQAIACNPKLLIADEPSSKLDTQLQADILGLLTNVVRRHRTALVLITHDPAILIGRADRVAMMYAGCMVEEGITAEVFENPLHPYTHSLLQLFNFEQGRRATRVDKLPAILGEAPDLSCPGPGCGFAPRCPERIPLCSRQDPRELRITQSHRVSCFKHAD